jgi:hypothetical protein
MAEQSVSGPIRIDDDLRDLGLESYVLDLELNGVTVVPPEVHGVGKDKIDELVRLILAQAKVLTGCEFDLEKGPLSDLEFPVDAEAELSRLSPEDAGEPSQFLIQQLGRLHRAFRDLAINPVAVALIGHMIGREEMRFSSHNTFVKWQGEYGYGSNLGLHADQGQTPRPWGATARTANTNWCLTDYTLEGGSFACVPGSNRSLRHPDFPNAVKGAVPIECPKGSCIVFHGATWHGAFPRKIPGMRLSVANYYRHVAVTSQEDFHGTFPQELADDCDNPELFKKLAGFADKFPYASQTQPIPKAVS